ncbi:hypothetical protein B296_00038671 [Ensete ventricosum]|uniref:Uncharacterized protein n=1 Tax=Ensete ventricosum TaxID=4639 RepID=A0A426ZVN9_ENSVE|nr:hypothetical protein B296_00038671 [Ensete ventricosum]
MGFVSFAGRVFFASVFLLAAYQEISLDRATVELGGEGAVQGGVGSDRELTKGVDGNGDSIEFEGQGEAIVEGEWIRVLSAGEREESSFSPMRRCHRNLLQYSMVELLGVDERLVEDTKAQQSN